WGNDPMAQASVPRPRGLRLWAGERPQSGQFVIVLPHPTLTSHYATPEAKPEFVNRLFDKGAAHYDAVVDWGFLHSGAAYRRWALRQHGLHPPQHLLDVACGTGLVAEEAARILGTAENITCLDPSEGMMAVARSKLSAHFVVGP